MSGTYRLEQLRQVVVSSLLFAGGDIEVCCPGVVVYQGHRPAGGWHAHGVFTRKLWVLTSTGL